MKASKQQQISEQLAALNKLEAENDTKIVISQLRPLLQHKNNRVVAKAAEWVEQKLLYDLEADLITAYHHFLNNAVKTDPHCTAKQALMRTLVALDCRDADFYLAGLRYRQLEPNWGGAVDTAIDIRCSSAMGLISTRYSRAMIELLDLLADPELNARMGAVRAIAYGAHYEAALVLRQKVTCGDSEPEVMGECFIALLQVEPMQSLSIVSSYLQSDDKLLFELAALALGQSRMDEAFERLHQAWKQTFSIHKQERSVLIRAGVLHRSEAAFAWLLSLLDNGDDWLSETIIEQLSIYKYDKKLKQRLKAKLQEVATARQLGFFTQHWD